MTPSTVACQSPLSLRFPRQEYWSGLPFPSPGDLSVPGIKPTSSALASGFFTTESAGKPRSKQEIGEWSWQQSRKLDLSWVLFNVFFWVEFFFIFFDHQLLPQHFY